MAHSPSAPKTIEDLVECLKGDSKVKVAGIDVDGVMRGKVMAKAKFVSAAREGFGFCSVIFGWDLHDQVYKKELGVSNKANGYRDLIAHVDLASFRRLPWEDDIPFFLIYFHDGETDEALSVCPRSLLRKVVQEYRDLGYEPMSGAEYEFYNFAETPKSLADKGFSNVQPLTPGNFGYSLLRTRLNQEFFHELFDTCDALGCPIEGLHTETGPGVLEAALAYTDTLTMGDRAALFKLTAKSLALGRGITSSFMAKPYNELPGCSGHVHFSLTHLESGQNAFAFEKGAESESHREDARYEDTRKITPLAEHFLAGILHGLPDIMPCLAPNINSYKRLNPTFWAPETVSWGLENRLASVRLIGAPVCSPKGTRFEVRVPGADMNPYYALAAILACGLVGIKENLSLPSAPLGSPQASTEKSPAPALPRTLAAATEAMMKPGSFARRALGDDFVDHYGGTRHHEVELYNMTVHNYDLQRYMELV